MLLWSLVKNIPGMLKWLVSQNVTIVFFLCEVAMKAWLVGLKWIWFLFFVIFLSNAEDESGHVQIKNLWRDRFYRSFFTNAQQPLIKFLKIWHGFRFCICIFHAFYKVERFCLCYFPISGRITLFYDAILCQKPVWQAFHDLQAVPRIHIIWNFGTVTWLCHTWYRN